MTDTSGEDLQKIALLDEKIQAPLLWGRLCCGIRFEDLQEGRYEDAVKLLRTHYIDQELTFRCMKIASSREATDEFIHNVRIWMKDKMSLAAVQEGPNELIGILLIRVHDRENFTRTLSRVKITYNPLYKTVVDFQNAIEDNINLFGILGVRKYMKLYLVAIKKEFRHRGIAKEMIKSAIDLARSTSLQAIVGLFPTSRAQQIAMELGFGKINEIHYDQYLVKDEVPFKDVGLGNYSCALMALRIADDMSE